MKTPFCIAALLFLGLALPLAAQNPSDGLTANPPASDTAQAESTVLGEQNPRTLDTRLGQNRGVESVIDLAVLEKPSPYRSIAMGRPANPADIPADGVKQDLALISAVYREAGKPDGNCLSVPLSVVQRVKLDASKLLEIVETEVKANPACSCEIVKAAIKASDADSESVVSIVETSILAAPEMMRIVSQCAIAVMPESLAGVQSLLARYDTNAGEGGYSSKSAKSSKDAKAAPQDDVAAMPNPLDFPGSGPVGPTNGGPGGFPLIPPTLPVIINPPTVTLVDP
jgi:hypothetical protein